VPSQFFILESPLMCCPVKNVMKKISICFHEEGVKFSSLKTLRIGFWSGICYLLNLPNGWQNPASKFANCYIENFTAKTVKILQDLAANQLKWQHC